MVILRHRLPGGGLRSVEDRFESPQISVKAGSDFFGRQCPAVNEVLDQVCRNRDQSRLVELAVADM